MKPNLLVVDNDALVRLGTVAMLKDMGYTPVSASGADEAMLVVKMHEAPDILVTDYAMPGKNGVELARDLSARIADLRVLIVTGHQEMDEPLEQDWVILQKPFTNEELEDAIAAFGLRS